MVSLLKRKKQTKDNENSTKVCVKERGNGPCHGEEIPLLDLQKGEEAIIASVPDMSLLPPLGFRPGKKVCMQAKGCFGGPVFAEIEKRSVALGRRLAGEIKVMLPELKEG